MGTEPFFLSFLSAETGCVAHELRFFAEASAIAAFLEHDGELTGWRFTLDADELRGLAQQFGLLLPEGETKAQLGTPHGLDAGPVRLVLTIAKKQARRPLADIYGFRRGCWCGGENETGAATPCKA